MRLSDALFNWLQMHIVWKARQTDRSAKDTVLFFEEMLREDHQVEQLEIAIKEEQYEISFRCEGEKKQQFFPIERAEKLLQEIMREPKYNQSFE